MDRFCHAAPMRLTHPTIHPVGRPVSFLFNDERIPAV